LTCRSVHTAREAIKLLRESGFSEEQVRKIITKYPGVLASNADWGLKPKIELFKTMGITGKDLGSLISKVPRLLGCNIDKI